MPRTLKREPARINIDVKNYSNHFNQMNFKGIVHNNNIYDVDQESFRNAKNVYVDEDSNLISRLPLMLDKLPIAYIVEGSGTVIEPIVPTGYVLKDIVTTGRVNIYVSEMNGLYRIVAMNLNGNTLKILPELVNDYHVNVVENYIIVFNNVDAVVLNIDKFDEGWKLLRDVAEIPVTKRVVGQDIFTEPGNQFTENYKEEYVLSDEVLSILPDGTAEVTINQLPNSINWTLDNANINTEFRILRPLNITLEANDIITVTTNENTGITVICVARQNYFMVSRNNGQSFERILYPDHNVFLNVASITKDGLHFFFIASNGIFVCDINTKNWNSIPYTFDGVGVNNICYFENINTFTFMLFRYDNVIPIIDVYWLGQGLKYDSYAENTLGVTTFQEKSNPQDTSNINLSKKDSAQFSMKIDVTDSKTSIIAWLPGLNSSSTFFMSIIGQGATDNAIINEITLLRPYGIITEVLEVISNSTFRGVRILGEGNDNFNQWRRFEAKIGQQFISPNWTNFEEFNILNVIDIIVDTNGIPINLETVYLTDLITSSLDGEANLPITSRSQTIKNKRDFYIVSGNTLYTNQLLDTSNITITYTRIIDAPFKQIPTVSHVNTELYLAFGNVLKITDNIRDGLEIKFNLPEINNQFFISNITGLINVSTSEVAIFLLNKIFLVVKMADELLGFRYDYLNTRLSTGIRLGDDVINTRDGVYTLYPTAHGLAVMNYQENVATTDQIVEYVTNDILDIWRDFYREESPIKLIQMVDYVFLSNGTKEYLMLDLRTMIWWAFDIPVPIIKMVTDQFELNVISNNLYKFEQNYISYRDFGRLYIDWYLESQLLHFNTPNHYKNMRQLIFQFQESTDISQTIQAQIKLYRKQITLHEPDIINFKVDGYRVFIKRFNYWKINELQYILSADLDTETPAQLRLNGITVKYERGDELRS